MYPIRLIVFGRPKLEAVRTLESHYRDLLKPWARLEFTELPEGKGTPSRQLKEEALRLRPVLAGIRCPVLLSPEGSPRTSEDFARWLGERMDRGDSMAFAIGSSHGFDATLKGEFRERCSLSAMTFPHDLTRVMFLEQLFRAFQILRGGPYHK